MVTFLHSGRDMSPFLLNGQDVASTTLPGIFCCFSDTGMSLVIGEMTTIRGYDFKVVVPEALARRIIRQLAVRTAAGALKSSDERTCEFFVNICI
jgi:hypothetical protein